jgi:hypothetical protein
MAEDGTPQRRPQRNSLANMMTSSALGGAKRSIAAAAAASAAASAAALQREQSLKSKRRPSLPALDHGVHNDRLKSEISQEEAEGMFTFVQTKSTALQTFTEEEMPQLVRLFSVLRFDEGQELVKRGEPGTWFGIILSGSVAVHLPTGGVIELPAGNIIGEMVIWTPDAR